MADAHGDWRSLEAAHRAERRRLLGVPDDAPVVALALSGGGIRSATVSLGALQALARAGALRHIDHLSTVSGGGYAGVFLCSLHLPDRLRREGEAAAPPTPEEMQAAATSAQAQLAATERRVEPEAEPEPALALDWLRNSGRYLAPNGSGDYRYAVALLLRNGLAIHYVIGISLLTLFLLLVLLHRASAGLVPAALAGWGDGGLWALAGLAVFGAAVLPLGIGYWYTERPQRESSGWWSGLTTFSSVVGLLLALVTAAWVASGAAPSPRAHAGGRALTAVLALAWLWYVAGWTVTRRAGAVRSTPAMQVTRTRLTQWLAVALGWTVLALAVGAVLAASGLLLPWLQEWHWPGLTGAGVLAAATALWKWVAGAMPDVREGGAGRQRLALQWLPWMAALVLALLVLLLWGVAAQWLLAQTAGSLRGWAVGAALLLALVTGVSFQFLNLSTLQNLYTARIVRAWLGASNRERVGAPPDSPWRAVTQPHPHDDMGLGLYHGAPGVLHSLAPQHLINVTVNDTMAARGALVQQDRKGLPLAATPHGYLVDGCFHARRDRPVREAPAFFEALSVGRWAGVSGAAFAPGLGRGTRPERALLLTLANVRLGYWWRAQTGPAGMARSLAMRLFSTQLHLLREAFGRFHGTDDSHWYLSDGGHFENTGVYELLRRRVDVILALDNGADPQHRFDDVANLLRVAALDFGARFEALTPQALADAWAGQPHAGLAALFGDPRGYPAAPRAGRQFLQAWRVTLPPVADGEAPHVALLVLSKPRLTEDDAADLVQYQAAHPAFPQEPTSDQFFDDEQWESYRHLGQAHLQRLLDATGAPAQPFTALVAALQALRTAG